MIFKYTNFLNWISLRFYYAIAVEGATDDELKYVKMSENGTLQVVSESSLLDGPTQFLWTINAASQSSFWGVKEERYMEVENCSEFMMFKSSKDREHKLRFQMMSSCDHSIFLVNGYDLFQLVDLPIFHYFLAFKSNNELYFLVRNPSIGESNSIQLQKVRFSGETLGNGLGTAAILEFQLHPTKEGMHRVRLIGTSYRLHILSKEDSSPEFWLRKKDKRFKQ